MSIVGVGLALGVACLGIFATRYVMRRAMYEQAFRVIHEGLDQSTLAYARLGDAFRRTADAFLVLSVALESAQVHAQK